MNSESSKPNCSSALRETHILFVELTPNPVTKRWAVMPKDSTSAQIGSISWYGPRQKYCFMPMAHCVFEQCCLREIADFCLDQTKLYYAAKANTALTKDDNR